jgi:thiol-disulfide isomerase/thioredoxin
MAKTKSRPGASQRREELKSQRQQRIATGGAHTGGRPRNTQKRRRNARQGTPWGLVVGALLVIAVVIGGFILISRLTSGGNGGSSSATPASPTVLGSVTNVSSTTLAAVGTGGVRNFLVPTNKAGGTQPPPLNGPGGKPEVFYYGAEYCPYCAAQRWAMVVALSRFGTFSNLQQTTSSADDAYASTPTFTFYKSSYTSKYIDFVAVESEGRTQGVPLQTPSAEQRQLFGTYDGPPYLNNGNQGSIPFTDIGNRYLSQGASYDPGVLRSNPKDPTSTPLSHEEIAAALANPRSPISKGILGSANYMTAAICQQTEQQPAAVCSTAPIPQIERSLGQTAFNDAHSALVGGLAFAPLDIPPRRRQG